MAEANKHMHQYSAADIERYHSGKMSAQEMHQLEKAAMEDPFLADALEGYQYSQQPVEDLNELKQRLLSKTEKAKVIPWQKSDARQQWLKIAAMVVLIAGLGWIVYQFGFGNKQNDVAVINDTLKERPSETPPSALTAPVSDTETSTLPQTENKPSATTRKKATANQITQEENQNIPNTTEGRIAAAETDAPVTAQSEKVYPQSTTDATVGKTQAASALKGSDTSTPSSATAEATETISPNANNVIVMRRARDTNMQEIVLGKSKMDTTGRKLNHIAFEDVQPEKGQQYYDDYVAQNLNLPEEIKMKNASGEVELSFEVNELGKPVNIKVEKSLCTDCDKEAIRLLKEGPKLVKKNKKKGKVRIRF